MNNNFILTVILICLLLVGIDIALYSWRRKKYKAGESIFSFLQGILKIANQWRTPPALPVNSFNKAKRITNVVSVPGKSMHIELSGELPEGTIVNITLEVVDEQGKITTQKRAVGQTVFAEKTEKQTDDNPQNLLHGQAFENKYLNQGISQKRSSIKGSLAARAGQFLTRAVTLTPKPENLDKILLAAAITIYAVVISLGIDRYPIYFFTDEAIHMNLASDFLRDGFKNYYGEFLPTFFTIEGWVNGTSVYVQVLPYLLFGKSLVATRLVSAVISLFGALAVGLLLRDAFKFKYYWAGIFLILTTPAWFLHARTAFEYVEVGSFYSIFLYFYSRYRAGKLRALYWAILAGALTFYTHGLGQILMGGTGMGLFIVDFRYHLHPERRKTVLNGLLLGAILLLPFARYYLVHPGETAAQVKRRGSYWVNENLSFIQKVGEYLGQYTYGLNPAYWYLPNKIDLNRHIMYQYGNGLLATLPLVVVGLIKTIKNIRQPSYRIVLIALLACPIPASVVAIGMPRMLWMTIPLALLGVIGLTAILDWVESHWHISSSWLSGGLFILLAGLSLFMLRDALINGPTWFKDYSLYGMQYGARQVFQDVVRKGLEEDPNRRYVVSPSWANGTEQFVAFFIPPENQARVSMGQPIDFINFLKQKPADLYFVATSDEYDKLILNAEFQNIKVDQTLSFPDGKPGFYVLTLEISDNIEKIIAAQKEVERKPIEETFKLNGQSIKTLHSPFGAGRLEDVFDNNADSLARVLSANPLLIDLTFLDPLQTNGVLIQTGSLPDFTIIISLYAPGSTQPVTYTQVFKGLPPDPVVTINFDNGPARSGRIKIEIKDNTSGDTSQIHIRTIQLK